MENSNNLGGMESLFKEAFNDLESKVDSMSAEQKMYLLKGFSLGYALGNLETNDSFKYNRFYSEVLEMLQ